MIGPGMSEQTIYANPFRTWTQLLRSLRQRIVTEAGLMQDATLLSPHMGEVLGSIAALINDCEDITKLVDDLQRKDLGAFEAFQRALEQA
jgi:hypothetical protein